DRPRVFYPGIELVAEAELSADSDLYLADHALDDELLFPAVFGIEAMTQAATALVSQQAGRLVLEDVEFRRPIVVTPGGTAEIRVAALRRADGVDVVIRSSDTSFQADHFSATLRWTTDEPDIPASIDRVADGLTVPIDPGLDMYGGMLFQGK